MPYQKKENKKQRDFKKKKNLRDKLPKNLSR